MMLCLTTTILAVSVAVGYFWLVHGAFARSALITTAQLYNLDVLVWRVVAIFAAVVVRVWGSEIFRTAARVALASLISINVFHDGLATGRYVRCNCWVLSVDHFRYSIPRPPTLNFGYEPRSKVLLTVVLRFVLRIFRSLLYVYSIHASIYEQSVNHTYLPEERLA